MVDGERRGDLHGIDMCKKKDLYPSHIFNT